MNYSLGVALGHSSAAVLLKGSEIIYAIEEEKIARVKGLTSFPSLSINYILDKENISINDLDSVSIGCKNIIEFCFNLRSLFRYFKKKSLFHTLLGYSFDAFNIIFPFNNLKKSVIMYFFFKLMQDFGFKKEKIFFFDHHLCHALSAIKCSPYKGGVVFTMDGKGDGFSSTLSYFDENNIYEIDKTEDLNSIGQLYQAVTIYLGFKHNRHEGKITGLAAYGDFQKTLSTFQKCITIKNGKIINQLNNNLEDSIKALKKIKNKKLINESYLRRLDKSLMKFAISFEIFFDFFEKNFSNISREDIAAGLQKHTEDLITLYLKKNLPTNKKFDICLAGGVFANVKVNQKIFELSFVKNIFVQPAMDDSGTALGAAIAKLNEKINFKTIYLGSSYKIKEFDTYLKENKINFKRSENYHCEIAKFLNEGKIVGRFNGRLEWGPRALGNRSILVKADDYSINEILNKRLNRTEFMPFAPMIIDTEAKTFLKNYTIDNIASRYMTVTFDIKSSLSKKIKGSIHIDNTARPQVLFKEDNLEMYNILKEYKKLSKVGVLLNTSFNLHEEPIIDSPILGIIALEKGAIDILSVENYLIYGNEN